MLSLKSVCGPLFLFFVMHASAQKIVYRLDNTVDVVDSIKKVVANYRVMLKTKSNAKMPLFVGIDMSDGNLNVYISCYSEKNILVKQLIRKTSRFIWIDKKNCLPVLFDVDIFSDELRGKIAYLNMDGWYIKAQRNDQNKWQVTQMNPTF